MLPDAAGLDGASRPCPKTTPEGRPMSRPTHSPWCGRYLPGHQVHYIQARLAVAELATAPTGEVTSIDQRGIHVVINGEERTYFTHDLGRAKRLLDQHGPTVKVQDRRALIWFALTPVSVRRRT
jgi:hypothetical protein